MWIYYAARSTVELEDVCEALEISLDLPPFEFDGHDTWRYAWSDNDIIGLYVTEADDFQTIETWIAGCPQGVNYQVSLCAEGEPPDFAWRLVRALKSEAVRFAERVSSDS